MSYCTHCGEFFFPKFANMKLCFTCFQKRDRALEQHDNLIDEVDRLRYAVEYWRRRAEEAPPSAAIPPDKLKVLIQLTHPDRHGNSQAANDATVWLLSLRKKT